MQNRTIALSQRVMEWVQKRVAGEEQRRIWRTSKRLRTNEHDLLLKKMARPSIDHFTRKDVRSMEMRRSRRSLSCAIYSFLFTLFQCRSGTDVVNDRCYDCSALRASQKALLRSRVARQAAFSIHGRNSQVSVYGNSCFGKLEWLPRSRLSPLLP